MSCLHVKAILFDLDGVLFNTEPLHRKAWIETMGSLGHAIDDEFLMPWTGIPCIDLATYFENNLSPSRDRALYHRQKGEMFRSIVQTELEAFGSVPALIRELAETIECGFVTSNDRIDADLMLEVAGYSRLLPIGVTYDDVERHKPDPEPYSVAASRLGVAPADCIVVEDSPSGVTSAKRAGMTVAGVTTSFGEDDLVGADVVHPDTKSACEWVISCLDAPISG